MAKLAVCAAVLLVLLVALSESSKSDFANDSLLHDDTQLCTFFHSEVGHYVCPMRFCCTQYQETQVPVKMLKSYRIQDNTGYCNIKAVVFRTKRNKNVCVWEITDVPLFIFKRKKKTKNNIGHLNQMAQGSKVPKKS
uniref:Chemokine interleukin-8-like domain-containing protein n=1 Tax=Stegastes partitus TaxID=144197 RepID=A0A3B5BD94_9TELE